MVYTAACGRQSDTGENRQVPREKSTQAKEAIESISGCNLRRLTGIRSPNRAASGCAISSCEVLASWISTFSIRSLGAVSFGFKSYML